MLEEILRRQSKIDLTNELFSSANQSIQDEIALTENDRENFLDKKQLE